MGHNSTATRLSDETRDLIEEARHVYLNNHPDLEGITLSRDKIIKQALNYYINH